jgi:hypothetical protein
MCYGRGNPKNKGKHEAGCEVLVYSGKKLVLKGGGGYFLFAEPLLKLELSPNLISTVFCRTLPIWICNTSQYLFRIISYGMYSGKAPHSA